MKLTFFRCIEFTKFVIVLSQKSFFKNIYFFIDIYSSSERP